MSHKTLFLTERSPRHQRSALTSAPPELDVVMLHSPSLAELLPHLPEAEFLISERAGVIDAEIIAAAPKLRLIQRLGSLVHDIDLAAARQANVAVCKWPLMSCILVAEHMVMQILALTKRLSDAKAVADAAERWGKPSQRTDENTFAYNWSGRTGGGTLAGATVGILGFGEIGAELARRLRPFLPERVLYHKRKQLPASVEQTLGLSYAALPEVIAASDVLCSLLPYSPATDHLLNAERLATMKPGALLVHCGSGSVIDEAALAEALTAGRLGGAALDTFEWEPLLPDNPLLPLARTPAMNVLLTPHIAAGTPPRAGADATRQSEFTNLLRSLRGEPLLHEVTVDHAAI